MPVALRTTAKSPKSKPTPDLLLDVRRITADKLNLNVTWIIPK